MTESINQANERLKPTGLYIVTESSSWGTEYAIRKEGHRMHYSQSGDSSVFWEKCDRPRSLAATIQLADRLAKAASADV